MSRSNTTRRIVDTTATPFEASSLEEPGQPEPSWLPLSYDHASGQGC